MSSMIVKSDQLIVIRRDLIDDKLSPNDICFIFNEFLIELERMEKRGIITANIFLDVVEDIIDAVLLILPYKLLHPRVLNHPLMYFLYQLLITILNNWRVPPLRLNIQEMDIFLKIVLIFVHAAEQVPAWSNDKDLNKKKDLLTTKQFLFKLREEIDHIVIHKQYLDDDRNIYALGLLAIKLLQGYPFHYRMGTNERLITDLVMNSLDGYDFSQVILQLENGKQLTNIEHYLLFTCWEYLSTTSLVKENSFIEPTSIDLIHYLTDELLRRLEQVLDKPSPIAPSSLAYIFERCDQLLSIHKLPSFDKHAPQIIDRLTKRLQNPLTTNANEDALIVVTLEAFYNLTKNTDILPIMKKRQLTSLFNKYTSIEMGKKRKLAFAILAEIMDEEKVNSNPSEITTFFIDELKQLDPNGYNPEVDTTLSSLTALMQHEQIKNEFVNQGGLKPLTSFIRDGDVDKQSDKQLEDTLKILWLCSINNLEALKIFQQDEKLMTQVNQLFDNAKNNANSSLEKAAEGLIWKVEKEEKFKQEQTDEAERKQQEKKRKAQETGVEEEEEEEEQYDCMISYSWADMDLAHKIFHHLTEKLGYKIWLDQEQMHGSTIQAMANAVEGAQFILMCMSDTYKRSANCQSEAEYAFNRKKHIVPIKMNKEFVPEGWLGFILGTRMYIDFGTYEFDKAIVLLDNEIQLQKKRRKDAKEQAKAERKIEADKMNKKEDQNNDDEMDMNNISSWSETVVQDFLKKKQLSDLLPLCNGINGEELLGLYEMCTNNSVSMYRELKLELLNIHEKVLPISTFLHFVSRLRSLNNKSSLLNKYIYSEHLDEYSLDDE